VHLERHAVDRLDAADLALKKAAIDREMDLQILHIEDHVRFHRTARRLVRQYVRC
jgi:hypothetical protein